MSPSARSQQALNELAAKAKARDKTSPSTEQEQITSLAKLDKARTALAECRTLEEVKRIRDIAEAARVYAKAAHLSRDAQNYAAEITLLAARKAGEILRDLAKKSENSGGRGKKRKVGASRTPTSTPYQEALKDSETPRRTAAKWQKLAEMPQETVERYIADTKAEQGEITQAGLRRAHAKEKPKPKKMPETADDRYRKLDGFVGNLYGGLPREQRKQEIREHATRLIENRG